MSDRKYSRADLSPELQEITNHSYDYPYSKGIEYPRDVYDYRQRVGGETYDVYANEDRSWGAGIASNYFKRDSQVYKIAMKIAAREDLTDKEVAAIEDRINTPFQGVLSPDYCTIIYQAVDQYNIQALDMLLKHGADPRLPYDPYTDGDAFRGFVRDMQDTFCPGFSIDATRLYLKYGYSPNFIDIGGRQDNETFLSYMVSVRVELAWVARMEAGGNPWARYDSWGGEMSIAASAANMTYLPFVDYMIAQPAYFSPKIARKEWIYELLNEMIGYQARDDLNTKNIQRQTRRILEITQLPPTEEILDYINYKPEPMPEELTEGQGAL